MTSKENLVERGLAAPGTNASSSRVLAGTDTNFGQCMGTVNVL